MIMLPSQLTAAEPAVQELTELSQRVISSSDRLSFSHFSLSCTKHTASEPRQQKQPASRSKISCRTVFCGNFAYFCMNVAF